jgi:hypothetical protein
VREDPGDDLARHEGEDQAERDGQAARVLDMVVRMVVHRLILTGRLSTVTLFTYDTR